MTEPYGWSTPFHTHGSNGEAAVLIHGFTGHPGHWLPLRENLAARGYTVVAPLLTGHGSDVRRLASSRWREWVRAGTEAALSVSDHRRVHLVGLSMGGMVAILTAPRVAAASLTTINTPILLRDARAYLTPLVHRVRPWVSGREEPAPDPALAHLWNPETMRSTAAIDQLLRIIWRGWREAGRLRRPALVIQSRSDAVVRPVSGRILARRLRGRLLWVDTHHNALLDPDREIVHRAVAGHLAMITEGDGVAH
ncbi:MAG: alpha/beta hydrolase [Actinomycetota bacterium]